MNLKTFTSNKMVDILAIQELNVCWTKVAHRNKIWDRFRGWKESSHLSVAFNTEDTDAKVSQTGGTALISINKISHIWDSSGVDKSKLGRWAWTRYQGTEGRNLRVVSVYRPVINDGYNSVYMQQLRYSVKHRQGICPREMFITDLREEILEWKIDGDSLVILGDWNEDIRSESMRD
jgi:exonuclease III